MTKRNTFAKSRVMRDIVTLMERDVVIVDKHTAANKVFCDKRTAERVLAHLWLEKLIHIKNWSRTYNNTTPMYKWGAGKDRPRPTPLTPAEKSREYRARPGVKERTAFMKRAKRSVGREIRLGVWGI